MVVHLLLDDFIVLLGHISVHKQFNVKKEENTQHFPVFLYHNEERKLSPSSN